MKLKLALFLAGGFGVMFVLGWVPTVEVRNDTFEVTCRACSRALSVGWGAVESEPADQEQHQLELHHAPPLWLLIAAHATPTG